MVDLNFDRERPGVVLDLTRVPELGEWGEDDGRLRVGAGVTYTRIMRELGEELPELAMASRTVGSPQIRNRGTVGGNLGTASQAGDADRKSTRLNSSNANISYAVFCLKKNENDK